jgi:uncharacterized membrane protein
VSTDDRLERLEQRMAVLETLVRQLAGRAGPQAPSIVVPPPTPEPARHPVPPPPPALGAGVPPAAGPAPSRPASGRTANPFPSLGSERWIGQRVFLGIGVVALLAAAGYLLKLSFDRGWISPVMRCVGGIVAGLAVGALGWRLEPRYRTYGAALVGAGAGIIYLCIWAASRLYGVLPSAPGIVGLALVSVALAMIAAAIDVEALGVAAALGAFFAPVFLGSDRTNADLLLLYLASMAAGLYVGLRERWWETRLLTFSGGWTLLAAAGERLSQHWAVLAAGVVLSLPIWWHALRHPRVLPIRLDSRVEGAGWSAGEAFYFLATPVLLGWAVHGLDRVRFDAAPWLPPFIVALPYLLAGYLRLRPAFAAVGAAAVAIAAMERWAGVPQVWALLALAVLWASLDPLLDRRDGRWYGLLTLLAALQQLFDGAAGARQAEDAAFTGPWALALWGGVAATVGFAARLWRVEGGREDIRLVRAGLWIIAGLMALFGVTGELRRYFELRTLDAKAAGLASGLAVSAWWLLFAAGLVTLGFRLSLQQARIAGLAVAGLAVAKVVFFDLSSLDALYRVGSVFLLALVALTLAYLYYRHDRSEQA